MAAPSLLVPQEAQERAASRSQRAVATSSPSVVHMAAISPEGAMMALWPSRSHPSSRPHLASPTTQVPFWYAPAYMTR